MLRRHAVFFVLIFFISILTTFSFQNCGQPLQVSNFSSENGIAESASFATLQVSLKFSTTSSSPGGKNKISFKSTDALTKTVVGKNVFIHNKPQPIRDFSAKFSHNTNDASHRFDPYKLLVQLKDSNDRVIYEQIVNNPSAIRHEAFAGDGKIESMASLTLAGFNLNLNLPDIPTTSKLEIYELTGLKPKRIASFNYKELKSETKVLDEKLPLNKQVSQKTFYDGGEPPVEIDVKIYNVDGSLTLIKDTPPASNKINIVVLSDGYLLSEMEQFRSDAKLMVDTLFLEEPFKSARNLFEVYFLEIPSLESCIKNSPSDPCNSALKSYFQDTTGRFLMPNSSKVDRYVDVGFNYSLPVDRTFRGVIANSNRWGGTGGSVFIQTNIQVESANIFSHEFGHNFGRLGDEYEVYYNNILLDAEFQRITCWPDMYVFGNSLNITSNQSQISNVWSSFLNLGTAEVGLFEGAGYCPKNRWRACLNSKMRDSSQLWCPVNEGLLSERIKSFGVIADPINTTPPVISNFTMPATAASRLISNVALSATDDVAVIGYLITETATAPMPSTPGWTSSAPTTFTFSGSGSGALTAYAWAKDGAGNVSLSRSATVTVTVPDIEKPRVTNFRMPSPSASRTITGITFAASDNVAVTGYKITELGVEPAPVASTPGWSSTPPTTFTSRGSGSGRVTVYAWAKDAAGNVSQGLLAMTTVTIAPAADIEKPNITNFTIPTQSTSRTITSGISITASDNVAVTGYLMTESATAPLASAPSWLSSAPTTFTFSGSGSGALTAYAWAKDAAGNVSLSRSAAVTVAVPPVLDIEKPRVTDFRMPSQSTSRTITGITFTASDNVAVTGYKITELGVEPAPVASTPGWSSTPPTTFTSRGSGSGRVTVYGWAKDAAGNVSSGFISMSTVTIVPAADTEKPNITNFTIPTQSTTRTITSGISITASDNVAVTGYLMTETATAPLATALGWSSSAPTTFTFSGSGSGALTAYAWAKDGAGNVSLSHSATLTVIVPDIEKPRVTDFRMPSQSTSRTITGITFAALDNVAVTGYKITELGVEPAPVASTPGWSSTPPTTFTSRGSGSGRVTVYGWAKDAAGNVSSGFISMSTVTIPP